VLEAAKLIPDQVKGVILVEGVNDPDFKYPPPVIAFIDSAFMDMIANPTVEKLQQFGFVVNNPEESLEKVKTMIDRDQTGWEEMLMENLRWSNEDYVDALKELNVPLITINADYQPTAEENFRKYVSDYDAKYVSGSGHVVMWDATDEFNKLLDESIKEIIARQ
jgi:pimeloyl-ACP methyl ester carboxylesterase